ncbi:MAG TPA: benzoate-CoA ligase family protein [Chloroflexota bacterium]|nr:benzoate-CoA ligase family protein [Chloroflexota bacterium]
MSSTDIPNKFNAAAYFVDRTAREHPDKTAIVYGTDEISYGYVQANVNRIGRALTELGVEIENRVALLLYDSPAFVYTFFGAMKIGAVPVPVNTLLKQADCEYILEDSRAKVLVVDAQLLPEVAPALDGLRYLRHVVVVGSGQIQLGDRVEVHDFDDLLAASKPELDAADTCKDDVAFWLYSSGTTGAPNAAVHLHHDMVVCTELYAKPVLRLTDRDRTFSIAKLFFAYGLGNSLYFPFAVGATTILFPGRPDPASIFQVVNTHRPTVFFGVPTSYSACLQALESGAQVDMSSVRIAVSAGEPLPAIICSRWLERTGVTILDGIGTTEILHIFISNYEGDVRPGSSGRVVEGYEAKLLDDEDRPVPLGEIGNLVVRGDSICSCYWNKHDITRAAIQGEWIRTRDKYHLDADGYFWYDGRSNDMLKVGGIWVSPAEVEQAIVEHPAVLECGVVGIQDADALMKPKAFVVLKEAGSGTDEMAREIQEFVKSKLAPYKYPRMVEFVDDLPKTATGKIQRYKLRT